jgi:hypothetical protein
MGIWIYTKAQSIRNVKNVGKKVFLIFEISLKHN